MPQTQRYRVENSACAGCLSGSGLTEYGLIGALILGFVVLSVTALGMNSQDQFRQITRTFDRILPHQTQVTQTGSAATDTTIASSNPSRGTFMIRLENGKSIFLENYPLDDYHDLNDEKASEQTRTIATQMRILSASLREEGVLSAQQADIMNRLSDATGRISDIARPLEDSMQSRTQRARMLVQSQIWVQGKNYTLEELAKLIRSIELSGEDGPEIEKIKSVLAELEASGALSDPVVHRIVTGMIARVEMIAQDLERSVSLPGEVNEAPEPEPHQDVIGGNG